MRVLVRTALLTAALGVGGHALAQNSSPVVGGEPMLPARNIVQNAVNSAEHTTLVAAVKAAGLVETLQGSGPFTVFAPTNAAFGKLPAGTVEDLLKPENKDKLQAVLTYHVVPGRLDALTFKKRLNDNGGRPVTLETVQGGRLTVAKNGHNYVVKDAQGNLARISAYDIYQSNGVIHVIESVLLP